MNRPPASLSMLPLPGSPGSSWAIYKAKFRGIFAGADNSVLVAFWLFGLVNNVLYVIILSAALDLVGPSVPKAVVLLADVLPSFVTKLIAPYFIHRVPYTIRVLIFCVLSSSGMFLIALTPPTQSGGSISLKLFGVIMASLSSGGGELSFLGLIHYYGPLSLAAWGSGTGGAGLIGAGLYVLLTATIGLSIKKSLLASAFLPCVMLLAFFIILPHGPLRHASKGYTDLPSNDIDDEDNSQGPITPASSSLLATDPRTAHSPARDFSPIRPLTSKLRLVANIRRARSLFFPYMLPLLLVYIAEYTVNQGVSPTLLYPLGPGVPFSAYREFYPFYNFLYQVGVFVSRSSTPFVRIHHLYAPSLLQVLNLGLLISHSLWNWIPSVYLIFIVVFWEGLLGGAVYVNTFAEIMDRVPEGEREFSLGATSVSDSGGICVAGFVGMVLEGALCGWQVRRGRGYCKEL